MEQIKAAEIYADFQNRFKKTMEKTIKLVKERGMRTELFVLPIDNVDRSIEHISNISKLIRLAASHRLWFILAAVRPDYQLFLERSFQNELLRSAPGSNASNWDQTQAIARRQAATSMRRTLPDKYQILIDPLEPEYCWGCLNGLELEKNEKQQLTKNGLNNSIFKKLANLFTINRQINELTPKYFKAFGIMLNKDNQILINADKEIDNTKDLVSDNLKAFGIKLYDDKPIIIDADKADLKTDSSVMEKNSKQLD